MKVKAYDVVKVPEHEWDNTPLKLRDPYIEYTRKNGFVYAINVEQYIEQQATPCEGK
jgi:hypothetical protein